MDTTGFAGAFGGMVTLPLVDPTDPLQIMNPNRREPTLLEVYDNLSADGSSLDFYETRVNGSSNLIRLDHIPIGGPIPVPATAVPHAGLAMLAPTGLAGSNSASLTVTGISKASPAVVTSAAHGLTSGNSVIISGATAAWAPLNATWTATVIDGNSFSIPVDSSLFVGAFNGTMILPPALAVGDFQGGELPALPDGTVRRTGLAGFTEIDDISIVTAPDEHSIGAPLTTALITHCTLMRYRLRVS